MNGRNKMEGHARIVRGLFCTAAGAICWGSSGTCCQYLFSHYEISALWLTAVRMILGGVIVSAMALLEQKKEAWRIFADRKEFGRLLLIALAGLLLCQYAYLSAIRFSNSGTATVLQSSCVVMVFVFVMLRKRLRPKAKQVLAIGMALAGVFLIATNGHPGTMVLSPEGLFWGLGAAAGGAVYSILSQEAVRTWGSRVISGYGMLIGGSVLGMTARISLIPPQMDQTGVLLVLFVILVGTVGGFTLFLRGISDIGPVKANLIGCLEPVSATVTSVLFLDEVFSFEDLLGFAFVLASVLLV